MIRKLTQDMHLSDRVKILSQILKSFILKSRQIKWISINIFKLLKVTITIIQIIQTDVIQMQIMLIQQVDLILNQLLLTVALPGKAHHVCLKTFGCFQMLYVYEKFNFIRLALTNCQKLNLRTVEREQSWRGARTLLSLLKSNTQKSIQNWFVYKEK